MSKPGSTAPCEWFPTLDPTSGRTYYYNSKTKETTWTKPIELATAHEKESIIRKKNETKRFFADMEANIINKLKKVWLLADSEQVPETGPMIWIETKASRSSSPVGLRSSNQAYNRIRTISSLDDEILSIMSTSRRLREKEKSRTAESKESQNRNSTLSCSSKEFYLSNNDSNSREENGRFSRSGSISQSSHGNGSGISEAKDDLDICKAQRHSMSHYKSSAIASPLPSPGLKRRNSTGTIYLGTTMSTQDNQSTIQCVCAVIHMHMLEAAREGRKPHKDFEIFEDRAQSDGGFVGYNDYDDRRNSGERIPSIATIRDFFLIIFSKSQLEFECIIMSLIYIERLMKETKGKLCMRPSNWKAILFACLVMASKVWDDLSMWNVDFCNVCPSFDLQRANSLELCMLEALKYLIKVSAGEYAKYYFHLRSMMSKLGLRENESSMLSPLDVKGARRLQLVTENFQENHLKSSSVGKSKTNIRTRSYTIVSGAGLDKMKHRLSSEDAYEQAPVGVGLEQLVHSAHVDADGRQHATPSVAKYRSLREFNPYLSDTTSSV